MFLYAYNRRQGSDGSICHKNKHFVFMPKVSCCIAVVEVMLSHCINVFLCVFLFLWLQSCMRVLPSSDQCQEVTAKILAVIEFCILGI